MTTLEQHLATTHGVASTSRLLSLGFTNRALSRAVTKGSVLRVRQGWYALPDVSPDVATAARVGGSLGCVSALRRAGVWLPADSRIHVSVSQHASRLRTDGASVVHWSRFAHPDAPAIVPVADALAQAALCLPREFALVALDSALNKKLVTTHELERSFSRLPLKARHLLSLCDATSQSGLETLARHRLKRWRMRVRTQMKISGVGRVDVLIGERLVLELDGRGFHDDDTSFEEDRRRDLELHRLGYIVIRLSYRQVMEQWPRAEQVVRALVQRRDHMWPRNSR